MKKIIAFVSTLLCAFLFAFAFGSKAYAEDDVTPTETTEEATTTEVITTTEAEEDDEDVFDFELSDEQVEKIAEVLGTYTNEDVKNMSLTLYASLGVAGFMLFVLFVIVVVLAVKKAKNDTTLQAVINGVRDVLGEEQKEKLDTILKNVQDNNKETTDLVKELIEIVAEKKNSKMAAASDDLDKTLAAATIKKVE